MGKAPKTLGDGSAGTVLGSQFYRNWETVARVQRKSWNKAIDLIEGHKLAKRRTTCQNHGPESRMSLKRVVSGVSMKILMLEIRQALLRHDWKSVHQLNMCMLEEFSNNTRVLCSKVLLTSLLNSSQSDYRIYADFCRMASGMDDDELKVFTKTIKRLPAEIPRGFIVSAKNMLLVKASLKATRDDATPADSYSRASQPVREEDEESQPN
ncbi:uncharacterized protein LOC117650955 [Thrips palmi]|uniref:Uncharacterized protein LOC117650955 n=1 Tax=Thrips palmi TaxID=161013 RepID=A0A6P9A0R1_THRPL|nr:uncharacterized protein LOC117650955 [Thrips palmi]